MDAAAEFASFFTSNRDAEAFEPFVSAEPGEEPRAFGEIHRIRAGGSGDGTLLVGIWRLREPTVSPIYSSPAGDETFLVLEGEVDVKVLETGEVFSFKPGDVGSWSKGTRTQWAFKSPFKKFVVVTDDKPMAD